MHEPPAGRERRTHEQPPGATIEETEDTLVLRVPGNRSRAPAVGVFLLLLGAVAFARGAELAAAWPWLPFGALYVAFLITEGFNAVEVRVGDGRVRGSSRPIPFPPDVVVRTDDIEQVFCSLPRWGLGYRGRASPFRFRVSVLLRSGRPRHLLRTVDSLDAAHWVEEHLERFLGIPDRPVKGEAPLGPLVEFRRRPPLAGVPGEDG